MARLIGRKGGPKVLEEGDPITKMKKKYMNQQEYYYDQGAGAAFGPA